MWTFVARPLEEQLVDWLHGFRPDADLCSLILDTIRAQVSGPSGDAALRRRDLAGQLERLRELYVIGDLPKAQYVMRRQALEEELERTVPPTDPDLERARALLEDFGRF